MRLRRMLELAVVLIALGIAAWLIEARFNDVQREARRVQVRMAAEAARTNGALFQLQCPHLDDTACTQRVMSRLRRAHLTTVSPVEGDRLPPGLAGAQARLWGLALASGVAPDQGEQGRWIADFDSADTLRVSLRGVTDCRFLLRIHLNSGSVTVEEQALTC
ncbi:hypothetical protein [Inhella gelatinilytica]|uniref:Uncharacterized protein n=1 Tax=Inhella gelatinilytica TaxID=2795030 RepID=A0A931NCJ3_9BURK|nr:hypothetical protein [Inhella gelatinilytica]MBH9551330.1 hypothetical protein [Inhella gelatinilytica]